MIKKTFIAIIAIGLFNSCQTDDLQLGEIETNSYEFTVNTKDLSGLVSRNSDTACY